WWRIVPEACYPNHQRRYHDDAQGVGGKPAEPRGQDRCPRTVEQNKTAGCHQAGEGSGNRRRGKQTEHAADGFQSEVLTPAAFDQPRQQKHLPAPSKRPPPPLHRANTTAAARLRAFIRLAAALAAAIAKVVGTCPAGPSTIRAPEAMPAAGQTTATQSGLHNKVNVRWAIRP